MVRVVVHDVLQSASSVDSASSSVRVGVSGDMKETVSGCFFLNTV